MQSGVYRLKALYPIGRDWGTMEVYGYCSKGLPGLEIVGMGTLGRSIKEKLIFLSRQFGVKIPLKRYVLCIDLPIELKKDKAADDCRWLELPLLILFWTLSAILELENLDDCLALGKVQVNGTILCPDLVELVCLDESKVIAPSFVGIPETCYLIPLEELFKDVCPKGMSYKLSQSA